VTPFGVRHGTGSSRDKVLHSVIYLDHAATSWPKPPEVARAMSAFLEHEAGGPNRGGHRLAGAAGRAVESCRWKLARLVNAPDASRMVHCLNGTDALNIALKGALREGDHVVCSALDHNSIARPLEAMVRRGFVSITRVGCGADTMINPDDVRAAVTPATRLVVLVHASNVTGAIQDMESIGAVAREHDLLLLVDAAQTAGVVPIDVQATPVDLLAFPGHKSLQGPPGTGALYVGTRAEPIPFREGGTGADSAAPLQPEALPTRLEAGTPNGVGIAGLSAALDGLDPTALARERSLLSRLRDGLQRLDGVTLYQAPSPEQSVSCLAFNLEDVSPEELAAILDESFGIAVRPGLHCAPHVHRMLGTFPDGSVRASLGPGTTEPDVDALIAALGEISASCR